MSSRLNIVLVAVVAALSVTPALAQSSGAIYTSNHQGDTVNGNIYRSKSKVYLNGGPAANSNCTSTGLEDGFYYFQVTNPSGSVLLSSDDITNRELVVVGGVVVATTGSHQLKNGNCGSKIAQLMPFDDTPSNGGEYKVWLTPVAQYDPLLSGFHGFISKFCKTDNFKVKGSGPIPDQSIICGYKFYDFSLSPAFSQNGIWDQGDPNELPIPGWRIEIWFNGAFQDVTYTDESGRYCFIRDLDPSAIYEIREVAPPPGFIPAPGGTWLNTSPVSGTVAADALQVDGPTFGNVVYELAPGVGYSKGYWHNQGEATCLASDPVWREALNGPAGSPLCLRTNVSTLDPNLSIFTVPVLPTSFADAFFAWANYIVGNGVFGHAGYNLSTQVAATKLNNAIGLMQGPVYIDRAVVGPENDPSLESLADMFEQARGLLCHPNAGLTGPNDPITILPNGIDLRTAMINCTNEYEAINSTSTLTSTQVVYTPKEESKEFGSPY